MVSENLTMGSKLEDVLAAFGDGFDMSQQFANLSVATIIMTLLTAALCGAIIYVVYRFFYRGVVYSDNFNILLLLTTVVTSFIIMTISANVVLSLGMVGALSIVRFRAAVKDPLDIGFLFWGIAAGITAGAQLYMVAIIGTVIISVIYILLTIFKKQRKSYLLIVRYTADSEINVNGILGAIKYKLKNKTQSGSSIELTVEVKIKNNDTSYISRFNAVEGVESVTLLEYSGEYMN
ncbi:MAG: DUF4956 domain-containing protein [Oscillospiraceae bacterium]|nr:DUF4956 domain-containing protein [Oscillospiraceae bacterium]MBQ4166086.1 DUF4956 domain-containing protein [Oscillospiraceae bacterium]